ncbi:MAG: AAA family ATPase [Sandaracinaceae bacterium]
MSEPTRQVLVPFRRPERLAHFPSSRPLLGRRAELEWVRQRIEAGERLLTLLGPPGIGKTALAVAIAEQLQSRLNGWFCDLSSQRTDAELRAQLLRCVVGRADPSLDVAEVLAELGPALVVLDNFEQLAHAAPRLAEWWAAAPEVVFVVTSRERLAIDRERILELSALATPRAGASPREAMDAEAVRLFVARARDAGATVDDADPWVQDIVRMLDGIPLAIELAAARTRLMPPAELARRLGHGEDMLAFRKRATPRHETLHDAIAWSWDLLSGDEQSALAVCSAFAASFDVGVGEQVLRGATAVPDPVGALMALRDKSLLHAAGEGRLGIYTSIRQFAARRLAEDPGLERAARGAHARAFVELAAAFVGTRLLIASTRESRSHGRLHEDVDNLACAFDFAERAAPELAHAAAELAAALTLLGAMTDATSARLGAALEAPVSHDAASEELARESYAVLAMAQHVELMLRGRPDDAFARLRAVADDLAASPAVRGAALIRLGAALRAHGDAHGALAAHEAAEPLFERAITSAHAVNVACMGRLMCDLRDADAARRFNERAKAICDELGEPWLAALGPANLAQLAQEGGDLERAEAVLEDAIERFREARETVYLTVYATVCAGLYLEWGKLDLARRWYRATQGSAERLIPGSQGVLLHGGWAVLEAREGDRAAAEHHLALARRTLVRGPAPLATAMHELFTAAVEVLDPRTDESVRARHRERADAIARGESDDAALIASHLDARFALRVLGRALAGTACERRLVLRRGGAGFAVSGAEPVDLGRRGALKRIVEALGERRLSEPGRPLDAAALFERGWPGQQIRSDSASTRVRVAIATLRKLGLKSVLLTEEDGYLFDPEVSVELEG